MPSYLIKEEEGIKKIDTCTLLNKNEIKNISNKTKIKIIDLLSEKPHFISEISKSLNVNEQNIYYHMNELRPLIKIVEGKKIRGVIAKKYALKSNNVCFNIKNSFKTYSKNQETKKNIHSFFKDIVKNNIFNAKIIVGSPDPHGPFKARCRDGHYAIDMSFYIGNLCDISKKFSVSLDVDINLKTEKNNLIVIGGPVTNLIMNQLTEFLPAKFQQEKHWAIKTLKNEYLEDNIGLIAKIPHPYYEKYHIIAIAGIRFSGTKAAVIGLTRQTNLILNKYNGQKKFFAIIEGFDLDGDGKLDSVELLE